MLGLEFDAMLKFPEERAKERKEGRERGREGGREGRVSESE